MPVPPRPRPPPPPSEEDREQSPPPGGACSWFEKVLVTLVERLVKKAGCAVSVGTVGSHIPKARRPVGLREVKLSHFMQQRPLVFLLTRCGQELLVRLTDGASTQVRTKTTLSHRPTSPCTHEERREASMVRALAPDLSERLGPNVARAVRRAEKQQRDARVGRHTLDKRLTTDACAGVSPCKLIPTRTPAPIASTFITSTLGIGSYMYDITLPLG